jgi:ATP-dependent Clp protease ATP-binding subunit ClpX
LNRQAVGYSTSKNVIILIKKLLQYIIPKDIKDFGLIPEIGRLPVLTHMDPLDRDSSCDDSTKNALIKQYQKIVFYG